MAGKITQRNLALPHGTRTLRTASVTHPLCADFFSCHLFGACDGRLALVIFRTSRPRPRGDPPPPRRGSRPIGRSGRVAFLLRAQQRDDVPLDPAAEQPGETRERPPERREPVLDARRHFRVALAAHERVTL